MVYNIVCAETRTYYIIETRNKGETMDIRIVKSELHTTASQDLEIEKDLEKNDASLAELLETHEKNTEQTESDN
jgi:hypothetical protein